MHVQFLKKGIEPPWLLLIEPVNMEESSDSRVILKSPVKEGSSRITLSVISSARIKKDSPRKVSISPLDFAAPENFIFLPPWAIEALNLKYVP